MPSPGKLNIQWWILRGWYILKFRNGRARLENIWPHFAFYLSMTIVARSWYECLAMENYTFSDGFCVDDIFWNLQTVAHDWKTSDRILLWTYPWLSWLVAHIDAFLREIKHSAMTSAWIICSELSKRSCTIEKRRTALCFVLTHDYRGS